MTAAASVFMDNVLDKLRLVQWGFRKEHHESPQRKYRRSTSHGRNQLYWAVLLIPNGQSQRHCANATWLLVITLVQKFLSPET